MDLLLDVRDLDKSYPRGGATVEVLRGCSLELAAGASVAVMGASGSGKSTFLNLLGGLDHPDRGEVRTDGRVLDFDDRRALTAWRAGSIGFVFQFHFLLPDFTARENLLLAVRTVRDVTDDDRQRADAILDELGLGPRAEHLPGELSGGEQQRVAVGRALMNRPRLVLADEPFGNLDQDIGSRLGELLFELCRREGASLVLVTHDPVLAGRADRVLHLVDGRLASDAAPAE
ncbi:MAG: ABC transporter ATP-binding protein [bacterium]|nr:ABC transporter ATP-binding protein [bacterium]